MWDTLCRVEGAKQRLQFAIDASTTVTAHVELSVHGHLRHLFRGEPSAHSLFLKTKNFGCVLLLLGKMGAGNRFLPSHAMLCQSGDWLEVPLLLEDVPTQKEFREVGGNSSSFPRIFFNCSRFIFMCVSYRQNVFFPLILSSLPADICLSLPCFMITCGPKSYSRTFRVIFSRLLVTFRASLIFSRLLVTFRASLSRVTPSPIPSAM